MRTYLLAEIFGTANLVWSLTILIILIGIILIFLAAKFLKKEDRKWLELPHDMVRDIGIAFLIAGLVTIVYGSTLDLKRVTDAISLMVGETVPQAIWDETKNEIFRRNIIRENAEIRLTIEKDNSLPSNQAVLRAEIGYDIYGLKPQPFSFIVKQELDTFLHNDDLSIPRFDLVVIANKEYKGEELKALVKDGVITLPEIIVQPWTKEDSTHSHGTRIIFKRAEIIYVPGQYNLVLSQLTKGVKLIIDAPGMDFKLKEWFDREGQSFQAAGSTHYYLDGIVFPGQSINVQFERTKDSNAKPKVSSVNPTK